MQGKKEARNSAGSVFRAIRKHRFVYLMLLPVALYFVVFSYYPLGLGIVSSLQDIKLLGNTKFVGLDNYKAVLTSPLYGQAFWNTIVVGTGTLILQFLWGLLIALLLNEVRSRIVKSVLQSVTYIPYLLSWSVVGGLWILLFSPSGMINGLLDLVRETDARPVVFMSQAEFARAIMIFTGAWKNAGYYAVLFLAAVVAIDPALYEAAAIDGASRLQQLLYITIPGIVPTMKIVLMLGVMGLLRNFDQIFIMGNASIFDQVRNLLYLIYTQGITQFKIGTATAGATLVFLATLAISTIVRKAIHYDETYEE